MGREESESHSSQTLPTAESSYCLLCTTRILYFSVRNSRFTALSAVGLRFRLAILSSFGLNVTLTTTSTIILLEMNRDVRPILSF